MTESTPASKRLSACRALRAAEGHGRADEVVAVHDGGPGGLVSEQDRDVAVDDGEPLRGRRVGPCLHARLDLAEEVVAPVRPLEGRVADDDPQRYAARQQLVVEAGGRPDRLGRHGVYGSMKDTRSRAARVSDACCSCSGRTKVRRSPWRWVPSARSWPKPLHTS